MKCCVVFIPFYSFFPFPGRGDRNGWLQKHVSWQRWENSWDLECNKLWNFLDRGMTLKTPPPAIPTRKCTWISHVIPREHPFNGMERRMLGFRVQIKLGSPSILITLIWIYKRKSRQLKAISSSTRNWWSCESSTHFNMETWKSSPSTKMSLHTSGTCWIEKPMWLLWTSARTTRM